MRICILSTLTVSPFVMCDKLSLPKYALAVSVPINFFEFNYSLVISIFWFLKEKDTDHLPLAICLYFPKLAYLILVLVAIRKNVRRLYKVSFFASLVFVLMATYGFIFYCYYSSSGYEKLFYDIGLGERATSYVILAVLLLDIIRNAVPPVSSFILWRRTTERYLEIEKEAFV